MNDHGTLDLARDRDMGNRLYRTDTLGPNQKHHFDEFYLPPTLWRRLKQEWGLKMAC